MDNGDGMSCDRRVYPFKCASALCATICCHVSVEDH